MSDRPAHGDPAARHAAPAGDTAADASAPRLHRAEDALLTALMAILVLLAVAQILLRNLFGITWLWAEPMVRHLVVWTSLFGAVIAARMGSHIRIDAVLRLLPEPWRATAGALGDAVAGGVCLFLTYVAVRFVRDERAYGGADVLDIPGWILELIFPLLFAGMGVRFSWRAGHDARRAWGQRHRTGGS